MRAPPAKARGAFSLVGLIADATPITIDPAMAVHANAEAHRTNVNAHAVQANASSNRANVSSDARPMPASATGVINPDAADDRARLGRYERNRRSRKAQCEDYSFHFCELQRRLHAARGKRPTGHFGCPGRCVSSTHHLSGYHVGRSRLVSGGGSTSASHWAWLDRFSRFGQSAVRNDRKSVSRASPCLAINLATL